FLPKEFPMPQDLNATLIFTKVVEQGSFVGAARILRLPKTTVSRKVQELESQLGASLLHRTTRRLGLTEAGNIYYEHSQNIARDLSEAESAVSQLQAGPRGWLRFTAPYSIGIDKIAPLLGEFSKRYPEINVEMLLSNESLDLIGGEIDGALRLTKHRQGNGYHWNLDDGSGPRTFQVDPVLVVNDPAAMKGALLCGEGLALTADVMVKPAVERGQVRRVLAGWKGADYPFSAVFPRGHARSPKVRAFVDFLLERLNLEIDYMSRHCPMSTCPDRS